MIIGKAREDGFLSEGEIRELMSAALEEPEQAIIVDAAASPEDIVSTIREKIGI